MVLCIHRFNHPRAMWYCGIYYWKISVFKWTQSCVVQGSAVYSVLCFCTLTHFHTHLSTVTIFSPPRSLKSSSSTATAFTARFVSEKPNQNLGILAHFEDESTYCSVAQSSATSGCPQEASGMTDWRWMFLSFQRWPHEVIPPALGFEFRFSLVLEWYQAINEKGIQHSESPDLIFKLSAFLGMHILRENS